MFPIGRIQEILFSSLPPETVVADGAVAPGLKRVTADGGDANVQMTLANADGFGVLMIFEATDVSNTVDLDFNAASGAVTWTASNVGDMLILLSNSAGKWAIVAGTAS